MRMFTAKAMTTVAALALAATAGNAAEVEVLHWWTSGGEAAALNVLKEDLAKKGIGWVDMPVAGGGGEAAMTILREALEGFIEPRRASTLLFEALEGLRGLLLGGATLYHLAMLTGSCLLLIGVLVPLDMRLLQKRVLGE